MVKKIISIILLFFLFIVKVYGSVNLTSDKYILYNLSDNMVLLEKDSHEETQIASLTKVMTVLVSIENIKNYDDKVIITKDMLKGLTWDIATIGLKENDEVTYNDLLYAAMLPSAADAVNALAISVSGSYENHVKKMNDKAKELELKNTHYSNVIGLTSDDNYSSAYDIGKLLKYALKNKKFKELFVAKEWTMSNNKKIYTTIKKFDSDYIIGSKTGYTTKAGRCIASISNFDNIDFLFVTLNNYSGGHIYIDETVDTYKYYDENYSYKIIAETNDVITTLKTKYSKEKEINVTPNEKYTYYLGNEFNKKDITYEYEGVDTISYFTKKGKKLGKVNVKYKNEIIKTFDVYYKGELNFSIFKFLWINKFYVLLISFIIFVIYRKKSKKIKRFIRRLTMNK